MMSGQPHRISSLLALLFSAFLLVTRPLIAHADDTWAVLVCSSRFWFNYRHVTNVMSMYNILRRLGFPDSRILLLLGEDIPANPRNPLPGTVYRSIGHDQNLYKGHVQVDYRGGTVSVDNLLRLLTGRHAPGVPLSHRLPLGPNSRVLLYMAGHGGDQFFKFHNVEEVSSDDMSEALEDMQACGRHGDLLMMIDTCQGGTMADKLVTPNVLSLASSARKQNSYAHQNDHYVGVALVDRFTDSTLDFFNTLTNPRLTQSAALHRILAFVEKTPFSQLLRSYRPSHIKSDPTLRVDLYPQPLDQLPLTRFFAWQPTTTILTKPPLDPPSPPPPSPLATPLLQTWVVVDQHQEEGDRERRHQGSQGGVEVEVDLATTAWALLVVPLAVCALLMAPTPHEATAGRAIPPSKKKTA